MTISTRAQDRAATAAPRPSAATLPLGIKFGRASGTVGVASLAAR